MALELNQELMTNVPEIDGQHRDLLVRIDALLQAWSADKNLSDVRSMLTFIEEHTAAHFGAEERFMAKYGYTNRCAHTAQHQIFVKTFLRLKERYLQNGADTALINETNELIVEWFLKHIRYSDKALALFLKNKMSGEVSRMAS